MWPQQHICEVADGIFTVIHGQGQMGVANASFLLEGKRAFLIDSMLLPEMAASLSRAIEHCGAHVDTIINTHHHLDHIGGNAYFRSARLLAHSQSIQAMEQLSGLPAEFYDRLMPQFQGHFTNLDLALPRPLSDDSELPHGGKLQVFFSAHTAADLCIWLPKERVVFAGDLCFIGVTPLALHGSLAGWITALDALITLDPAVVIPGHGKVGTCKDLIILRDYFAALSQLAHTSLQEKVSLQEALANFDAGPLAEWIEAERTALNLERAMQEAAGMQARAAISR